MIFAQYNALWLWVPAFAGTTMCGHTFTFSRHDAPELLQKFLAAQQRAWGMPGAQRTRSPLCNKKAQG
jgi:hypothetical protein